MSQHRYPIRSLIADYLRSGIGLAIVGLPLIMADMATAIIILFLGLAGIFGTYLMRTVNRQITVIEMDDVGLRAVGGWPGQVRWADLRDVNLRYFSTRRDRQGGWLHLRLAGDGVIRLDSAISGFDAMAARAYHEAQQRDLTLTPVSIDNFSSMGLKE